MAPRSPMCSTMKQAASGCRPSRGSSPSVKRCTQVTMTINESATRSYPCSDNDQEIDDVYIWDKSIRSRDTLGRFYLPICSIVVPGRRSGLGRRDRVSEQPQGCRPTHKDIVLKHSGSLRVVRKNICLRRRNRSLRTKH
jgi:hypothetical protein